MTPERLENPAMPHSDRAGGGADFMASVMPYEKQLDLDPRWALSEGSRFFENQGAVQEALRKITARLNSLGIAYSIVGGMALFHHGYRRFTEDVGILVTREGLKTIHEKLDGLGYVPPFSGARNLRDADLGVKIEFLVTGDFPGDGKPKPIAFPDPVAAGFESDGIRYLHLQCLIELKLASGMTNIHRMRDLSDVIELIKILKLPLEYGLSLDLFVREKYAELWRGSRGRFMRVVEGAPADVRSIDDLITKDVPSAYQAMRDDGVTIERRGDVVWLVTTDPIIAEKYAMHEESELWDGG